MSTIQIPWAPGAKYIKVICRLGEPRPDASDSDDYPDLMTQEGTVRLTCNAKKIRYKEEDGRSRMLTTKEWVFKIRASDGELYNETSGEVGVYVLSGDSSGCDPQGFTWSAVVTPASGDSWTAVIPATGVEVYDLVSAADVIPPSAGQSTLASRMAELESKWENFAAPSGPPNVLSIGTVSDVPNNQPAEVEITGNSPKQVLNFKLKEGKEGPPGPKPTFQWFGTSLKIDDLNPVDLQGVPGNPGKDSNVPGPPNTLSIGTVTTGAAGSNASASITGTAPNQTLNLTIPRGATGVQGPTFGADGSIIAAGRPDVAATMDSATQAAVSAAPSGTFFRSTDGAKVGAWIWMKKNGYWKVVDGDTGWCDISSLFTSAVIGGTLKVRRFAQTVAINWADVKTDGQNGDRFLTTTWPSGFQAVGNYYDAYWMSSSTRARFDIVAGSLRSGTPNANMWIRDLQIKPCVQDWPISHPGPVTW